jgi:hypothetical protein
MASSIGNTEKLRTPVLQPGDEVVEMIINNRR